MSPYFKLILTSVMVLGMFFPQTTQADTPSESVSTMTRISYNLQMVTAGIDFFCKENSRLPMSASELMDSGFIPAGLENAVTGLPIMLDATPVEPGGLTVTCFDSSSMIVSIGHRDGSVKDFDIDSSIYSSLDWLEKPDRTMVLYTEWAEIALQKYLMEYGEVPSSVDDLIDARYWPFEGQLNPFTGDPLNLYGDSDGDLSWEFYPDYVRVGVYLSGNIVTMAQVPIETLSQ